MTRHTLLATGLALITLGGCGTSGPAHLGAGRGAYNEVVNRTEDEQLLSIIVRQRFDDSFGLLAVSSITASLTIGVTAGANAGVGPRESYAGNLVPLSAQATYEENPTITYQPVSGEQFVHRLLAPLTPEQTLLLSRMSTERLEALPLLVRRINGLRNPAFAAGRPVPHDTGFSRFIELYAELRDRGLLDLVSTTTDQFQLYIRDDAKSRELLALLGLVTSFDAANPRVVPLRFFVGQPTPDAIDIETPSALEILRAAARGVEVPPAHAGMTPSAAPVGISLISVHSAQSRPEHAAVAIQHRGLWFFIDDRDARSKQSLLVLRTLIGLRLTTTAPPQPAPTLTIPVGG